MTDKKTGMRKGLTRYGDEGFSLYLRKAFIKGMGYTDDALDRPIVGITNTYSAYNACHGTVPQLIEAIKRGVMLAGGLPVEFPTITIHESFAFPTSMYMRNLMAIDTEEMVRAQPMDSVVLIGGCDKTVPALLMGAASAGIPAILEVTGPMLPGSHKGERLGACTDCRRFWGKYRAGEIDEEEIAQITDQLVPSAGTCGVMGTASTMAILGEALGMMLPGGACIPAVLADRFRHAEQTGAQAVQMAKDGSPTPDQIMTADSFRNALTVLQAIGGSTNAIVHLAAMAGRLGLDIDLDEFDQIGRQTQVLVDLKPSGENYMDDMHKAGGTGPLLRELGDSLIRSAMTVNGKTLGENIDALPAAFDQSIIRTRNNPIAKSGGMAVLKGNLAPDRCVIKHVAASPELLNHTGRAVVFKNMEDLVNRIDDPDLDVDKDCVLVMQNAGPKGAPGMPESGYLPIPKKLAAAGVKDMVRISDARMSGTAFGTIILHVAPESAIGGPLALVEDGDLIKLDVENRRLDLLVSDEELAARRARWTPPPPHPGSERGYSKLYQDTVTQAPLGCDFDFLRARK
ncbi:MAG: dihydroxy-acid dehydratase [Rhodospirillales bacterium]|nr:dihydroxy-acid dehydratase [Rhodospirillales bacterium]